MPSLDVLQSGLHGNQFRARRLSGDAVRQRLIRSRYLGSKEADFGANSFHNEIEVPLDVFRFVERHLFSVETRSNFRILFLIVASGGYAAEAVSTGGAPRRET